MKELLKLKSWQIFILLGIPFFTIDIETFGEKLINSIVSIIYFIWIGSIYKYFSAPNEKITKRYKIIFIFALIFITITNFEEKEFEINEYLMLIIAIPIISAFLYLIIHSSIAFHQYSLQTNNYKFNTFGAFIFLTTFPIGIWIIQPIINKMIDEKLLKTNQTT